MQFGGRYGSRGGAGISPKGSRFSWSSKNEEDGDGRGDRGRSVVDGGGERGGSDGVRERGDPGVGDRTWYDGDRER
jgi:hypothetical protein